MLLAWEEGASRASSSASGRCGCAKFAPLWPAVLEALPYNYAFLSSPVVDPAFADAVIAAFFAAIEKSPRCPTSSVCTSLDAEGRAIAAMMKALDRARRAAAGAFRDARGPS